MFFKDKNGSRFPISRIREIGRDHREWHYKDREQPQHVDVKLDDGDSTQISFFELDLLLKSEVVTIPSVPDYFTLGFDESEKSEEIWKTAVIGWSVPMEGPAIPITIDGLNDGLTDSPAILTPNGKVVWPGISSWESVDDFLASKRSPP